VLVNPITAKAQKQSNVGGWVFEVAEGNWGRLGAPQQHRQPPVVPPSRDSTDLRPQQNSAWHPPCRNQVLWGHQTSEPAERRKGTAQRSLQHSPRSLRYSPHRPFGCGWHHLQHSHTLKPIKELGLDSQRVKKLASKLHVHSVNFAAKLVHTRRALSNTVFDSHQEPVSGQACKPLDPHWLFLSFSRWRSFTVLGTKVASFP